MIRGMTGYGSATFSAGKIKGAVEIKSQNHRYFDIAFFLPLGFGSVENKIRDIVSQEVKRGRVAVAIKILERPGHHVTVNKEAVKEYLRHATALKKEFGLQDNLTMADLVRLPGVVETEEIPLHLEALWPDLERALLKAGNSLVAMRTREGRSLAKDTSAVLRRMLLQTKTITTRAKEILEAKQKTATPEELLSFQKGTDINEELARLRHYVEEFQLLVRTGALAGKKMDFVAQEMQRETNTIGSKLQDKVVSTAVIALKSKIEKLREQAQNIE